MLLDLRTLEDAHSRLEWTFEASAADPGDDDFVVGGPVSLAFDLHKDGDEYHLVGRIRTTIALLCSRCLVRYPNSVDIPFDLLYLPHSRNVGEGEIEVHGEDLATAFYRDDHIDLWQLMREQFYLAVPMKPLCREDCRGLCPECGMNLNLETCGCTREWEDPRLAGLKTLLNRNP